MHILDWIDSFLLDTQLEVLASWPLTVRVDSSSAAVPTATILETETNFVHFTSKHYHFSAFDIFQKPSLLSTLPLLFL